MSATPPAPLLAPVPDHVPAGRVVDIDIYALPGQEEDFHRAWSALQQSASGLVWTPRNEGHWIALSGSLLAEVQSSHERFSNRVIVLPKSVGELHALIPTTIDPPEHRPYRKLLNDGMALAKVRRMHEAIRSAAVELIEDFAPQGRCDFTHDFAQVLPIRIFLALVDLPMADVPCIRLWAESMTRPNPPMPFAEARQAFFAYLDPIIAARRASPGEDLLSQMVGADMGGRRLDRDEALSLCTQVLIAGVDTVVNMLGFVMLFLARDRAARAELVGLEFNGMLAATHELFRRFGLVTVAREVRAETVLDGCTLKPGDMVCVPTQVHGLDPVVNPDPLRVDFARRGARHSAFGSGPHLCPGQELARAEVAITVQEWLRRIPDFRLAADADTSCSGGIVGQVNRVVLEWNR